MTADFDQFKQLAEAWVAGYVAADTEVGDGHSHDGDVCPACFYLGADWGWKQSELGNAAWPEQKPLEPHMNLVDYDT